MFHCGKNLAMLAILVGQEERLNKVAESRGNYNIKLEIERG